MFISRNEDGGSIRRAGRTALLAALNWEFPAGSVSEVLAVPVEVGRPEAWAWAARDQSDPFQAEVPPSIQVVSSPDRNLDGVLIRDQLAIFSGHGCDVWSGILWPALIAFPEIAAKQYNLTNEMSTDERLMLACCVAVLQGPDILILDSQALGAGGKVSPRLRHRLESVASVLQIAIVISAR